MWQDRGQVPPMPDWIVRPDSAEEISKILKIANYYKIPVHIWGGGSGSQGGALPMSGGILLDMKRMCRLIAVSYTHLDVYKRQVYRSKSGTETLRSCCQGVSGCARILQSGGIDIS